jgi:hypothetical protein
MQAANKPENTVSVELDGIEEIFADSGGQMVADMAKNITSGHQTVATISKASRLLQIPYTTLRRQVKEGRFKTQTGPDGKTLLLLDTYLLSSGGQMVADSIHLATGGGQVLATADNVGQPDKLLELIERQSKQLQDASCRIGWLESQLQEREKELKLLTDSQYKPGWWPRLKSWLKSDR